MGVVRVRLAPARSSHVVKMGYHERSPLFRNARSRLERPLETGRAFPLSVTLMPLLLVAWCALLSATILAGHQSLHDRIAGGRLFGPDLGITLQFSHIGLDFQGRTDGDGAHVIAVRRRISPTARHARSSTRALGVGLRDSGRARRAGATTGRQQRPLPISPRNPRDA
jgi:hypothetical protein